MYIIRRVFNIVIVVLLLIVVIVIVVGVVDKFIVVGY